MRALIYYDIDADLSIVQNKRLAFIGNGLGAITKDCPTCTHVEAGDV